MCIRDRRSTSSGRCRSARVTAPAGPAASIPTGCPPRITAPTGSGTSTAATTSPRTDCGASPACTSGKNTLAALKTIRAARPDTDPIYVIMDNLSANKTPAIRTWAAAANVELCFTPTNSSWADPVEAQFGPLRSFVIGNSNQPNHLALARAMQAYLRWRNTHNRDPDVLAAQRRERARVRSQRHQRWGRPRPRDPDTPGSRSWTPHQGGCASDRRGGWLGLV